MSRNSRLTLAVASLALLLMFFLPLWKISLEAPQYPEGIGLRIGIQTITGQGPNDLTNINNLNHYIGMKEIIPESIPELKIMPWIIAGLAAFGFLTALSGKRILLYVWVFIFLAVAVAGLVDFYLWEYDYGHNLNPMAAIKIPGMSYQPPLIGAKKLLNFNAISLPGTGGIIAGLSLLTGIMLSFVEYRKGRRS